MKTLPLLGCFVAVSGCLAAGVFLPKIVADQRKPDEAAMRRYVVSRLSDSDIRKIHAAAQEQFEKDVAASKADAIKADAEIKQRLARCSDVVYRERAGPGVCSTPLGWTGGAYAGGLRFPSAAENYETMLMLPCLMVDTVRAARKAGCLPP